MKKPIVTSLLFLLIFANSTAQAATLPVSGRITSESGDWIDGEALFKFMICSSESLSDTSGTAVWSSDPTTSSTSCREPNDYVVATLSYGYFNVLLGSEDIDGMSELPDQALSGTEDRIVHIWFSAGNEDEFFYFGSHKIEATPRATDAQTLDGHPLSDFLLQDDDSDSALIDADRLRPFNTSRDLNLGDTGVDQNATITANVSGSSDPALRYNASSRKWQISNDGSTYSDLLTVAATIASAFVGSGSTTDAVDLGTAEVSGTLADANVTDALTISGGTVNATTIGASSPAAGTFTTLTASTSATLGSGSASSAGTLVLHDADSSDSNTTTLKASADVGSSFSLSLPADAGTVNYVLTTDGSGNLSWSSKSSNPQNLFSTIDAASGTDPSADSATDTLTLAAGSANITITGNSTTDSITFDIADSYLLNTGDTGAGNYDFTAAVMLGASPFVFEGSTADAFETSLAIANPTADRTIIFPDSSGTLALTSEINAQNIFQTVDTPAGTDPVADTTTDTLTFAAGSSNITITGTSGTDTVTFDIADSYLLNNGDTATGAYDFTGAELSGASPLVLEGGTANGFETTIAVTDPTADRTITVPNASGTMLIEGASAGGDLTGTYPSPTITTDAVALATDTTGNYVATITAGSGLSSTGATSGENIAHTLSLGALTADWNQTGAFDLVLDNASADLILKSASSELLIMESAGATYYATLDAGNLGADITVTLPTSTGTLALTSEINAQNIFQTVDTPAGTDPVADTTTDTLTFAAGSSNITITGTSGTDTVTFDIADSYLLNNGDTATGAYDFTGAELSGASPLVLEGGTANGFETTIAVTDPTADRTITIPNSSGTMLLEGASAGGDLTGTYPSPTITTDAVALATDTTGNYVATITAGSGLSSTGATSGENIAHTLSLGALTADWNQTGAFDLVLDNASADLILKSASSELLIMESAGATYYATLDAGNLGADITVTLPTSTGTLALTSEINAQNIFQTVDTPAGTDPVADTTTDTLTFAAGSSNITITGNSSTDTITLDVADSYLLNNGDTATGTYDFTGAELSGASPLVLEGGTANGFETTIAVTDPTADRTITVPNASGTMLIEGASAGGDLTGTYPSPTITTDSVALATDTTGNYVATITAGSGLSSTGATSGENIAHTLSLGALTADWNQTGAFDIQLNNASSELKILESAGATYYATLDVGNLGADRTFTFADESGTICTTGNVCSGYQASSSAVTTSTSAGGDLTGTYPNPTITSDAVALATDTTGNYTATITAGSGISSTGATTGENIAHTLSLGALTADWNQTGAYDIQLNNASSELKILESVGATYYAILDAANFSADRTATFPDGTGTVVLESVSTTNINIDGGAIDNTPIGASTAAAGTFTSVTASSAIAANGGISFDTSTDLVGDVQNQNLLDKSATETVSGNWTFTGNVDLNGSILLGASPMTLEGGTADGFETTIAVVNPTADRTITLPNADGTTVLEGLSTTNINIDGGAIDNTPIGAGTAAAITGTTVTAANLTLTGAMTLDITTKTTNYTITTSDYILLGNPSGGASMTFTLPSASSGLTFLVKNIDAEGGTVSIATPGAELIDGSGSDYAMATQNQSVQITSDGTDWWITMK